VPYPTHIPWYAHPSNSLWILQNTDLLIIQYSSLLCSFHLLWCTLPAFGLKSPNHDFCPHSQPLTLKSNENSMWYITEYILHFLKKSYTLCIIPFILSWTIKTMTSWYYRYIQHLSLPNSPLLAANVIPINKKNPVLKWWLAFPIPYKMSNNLLVSYHPSRIQPVVPLRLNYTRKDIHSFYCNELCCSNNRKTLFWTL
jgi:hypothetical protein